MLLIHFLQINWGSFNDIITWVSLITSCCASQIVVWKVAPALDILVNHSLSLSLFFTRWFFLFSTLVFNNVCFSSSRSSDVIHNVMAFNSCNQPTRFALSLSLFLSLLYMCRTVLVFTVELCLTRKKKAPWEIVEASHLFFILLHWRQWHFRGGSTYRKLTPTAITYLEVPAHRGNYSDFLID